MTWPIDDLTTPDVDQGTDKPSLFRPMLKTLVDRVKEIIGSRGVANGVCDLDAVGAVPLGRLDGVQLQDDQLDDIAAIIPTKGGILGMSATNVLKLLIGTDGQVPIADASQALGVRWGDLVIPAVSGRQVFTSGGTFNVPADVTQVWVSMAGGGGGGGGGYKGPAGLGGSGGGGGHAVLRQPVTVTPTENVTVTVGAAGAGGAYNIGSGGNGGTSSFGAYVSCPGGVGGGRNNELGTAGGSGGSDGGIRAGDDLAGLGGGSIFGAGGRPGTKQIINSSAYVGGVGGGYGAGGGGGGFWTTGYVTAGGAGAPGIIIVEW